MKKGEAQWKYTHFGNQVDAREGRGRPLLALDQGGTATNPTHQGFTFCHHMALCGPPLCAYYAMQDIFELSMILATHSQCNLISLDVFEDDIPEVPYIRQITFSRQYHVLHLHRFMKGYKKTWQPSHPW